MLKKILLSSLFLVFASVVLVGVWFDRWLQQPLNLPEHGLEYQLEAGSSVAHVAYDLHRSGVLSYPKVFLLYARLTHQTSVKLGRYDIPQSSTVAQLLQQLVAGKVISYKLTIVEGWTYRQALSYLHAQPNLESLLKPNDWPQNKQLLGLDAVHPEGWFFPDTYTYSAGDSDTDVLKRAHKAMQLTLQEEWLKRDKNLPYDNAYQALVMASIVERETGAPNEREQIAGVFVRRLNTGMRLQTDPTVIYGMGDNYKGNIRRSDLRAKTPYNTYTMHGLPPTPIALPGREAIYAALHPDSSQAVFFVARGDGSHQFSNNLADHNKAVRKYQLRRRSDYRSAPAP